MGKRLGPVVSVLSLVAHLRAAFTSALTILPRRCEVQRQGGFKGGCNHSRSCGASAIPVYDLREPEMVDGVGLDCSTTPTRTTRLVNILGGTYFPSQRFYSAPTYDRIPPP